MHKRRHKFLLSNLCIFSSRNVLLFPKTLVILLRLRRDLHRLSTDLLTYCQRFCLILSLISLSFFAELCTDSAQTRQTLLSLHCLLSCTDSPDLARVHRLSLHILPETVRDSAWFSIWFLSLLFFAELCTDSAQTQQTLRDSAADSANHTWLCTDFATYSHSFVLLTLCTDYRESDSLVERACMSSEMILKSWSFILNFQCRLWQFSEVLWSSHPVNIPNSLLFLSLETLATLSFITLIIIYLLWTLAHTPANLDYIRHKSTFGFQAVTRARYSS